MKERIITITVKFDMTKILENMITSKEKVKEMVERKVEKEFEWDEGYNGVEVKVIDKS